MKKRMEIFVLMLLLAGILTGCVSDEDFKSLKRRVNYLEDSVEAIEKSLEEETMIDISEYREMLIRVEKLEKAIAQDKEEITSISCDIWQIGMFQMVLVDTEEEAIQNLVEIEISKIDSKRRSRGIFANFIITKEMGNVIIKQQKELNMERELSKDEKLVTDGGYILYDYWLMPTVGDCYIYKVYFEVQGEGKTKYFAVELK